MLAVYALNPSHRWVDGVGLLLVDHRAFLPGSAFPEGTAQVLALAVGLLAAFALACRLSSRQRNVLLYVILAGAAVMAIVVLSQRLKPSRWSIHEYTGVFVNENHFAVYANLHLPVMFALASRARFRAVQEGRVTSPAGIFMLAGLLLAAAVVMSRSRAGVAVMAVLALVHVWNRFRLHRLHPFLDAPLFRLFRALGWIAVGVAAWLAVASIAREWRQLADILREWNFRTGILRDTLRAWLDRPTWGTGPGSFTAVFPYYQSELFQGRTILHAHSEPIQWLSEYGWAGTLWMAGAAWLALSTRPRPRGPDGSDQPEIPAFSDWERPALAAGLLGLALHSLIDFPLRVPLIAMLAAVWAGLWAGSRPAREIAGVAS